MLLRVDEAGRPWHWCPACRRLHPLPSDTGKWTFNQNFERPTFAPSLKHSGLQIVTDAQGRWTGEWVRDANGNGIPCICHYIITDGVITYCADSTHAMNTSVIPMPHIPEDAE